MAREAWTDERLDDLNHRVDEGFREMHEEFRAVNNNLLAMQRTMMEQFAAQQRTMLQLFVTMLIGFVSVTATILVAV